MSKHALPDPRAVVLSLDADTLRERLTDVEGEADALRVLLRAAQARERARQATADQRKPRGQE